MVGQIRVPPHEPPLPKLDQVVSFPGELSSPITVPSMFLVPSEKNNGDMGKVKLSHFAINSQMELKWTFERESRAVGV